VQTCKEVSEVPELTPDREAMERALADLQGMFAAAMGKLGESPYHVGLHGTRMLAATAEVVIGWLLLRHGQVALKALAGAPSEEDAAYYRGKLASLRFYGQNVLPGITLTRKIVEKSTLELMSVDVASF
jgi:hypothetical protein